MHARIYSFLLVISLVLLSTSFVSIAVPSVQAADKADLLTEENYNKIHVGMTSDEVKEILGKPSSGAGSKSSWTNTWHGADKKDKIDIHLKDSVVDRKSTTFSWGKGDAAKPDAATRTAGRDGG